MPKNKKSNTENTEQVVMVQEPEIRILSLYGPIDEENIEKAVTTVLAFSCLGSEPIQMIISTNGGLATEMFALYDVMRGTRKDIELSTIGLGKIMSAGVLLLAAGTKGKRKVGKHCKVMIHGLKTEIGGYMGDIQNDYDELKSIESVYIKALAKETNMSKKYLKNLFREKRDIYLTAEEAVELGIADEII